MELAYYELGHERPKEVELLRGKTNLAIFTPRTLTTHFFFPDVVLLTRCEIFTNTQLLKLVLP